VFVLSSLREGLPNVVLEAMASARPVIATRCNGIPRLLSHGQNGLVVSPDSSEALHDALLQCCQSESLRQRLAQAARRTVEEQFSFERRMQKVVEVYRRLSPALAQAVPAAAVPQLPPAAPTSVSAAPAERPDASRRPLPQPAE